MNKPVGGCIPEIIAAAGRPLSDDELIDLTEELQLRVKQRQRVNKIDNYDKIVKDAADDYAKEIAAAAAIEGRNAAINLKVRLQIADKIKTQFADDPELGLESVLVGVNRARKGARLSAAAAQENLKNKYLGGFVSDLMQAGIHKEFLSGAYDRDVARLLWAQNRKTPLPTRAPREAQAIAKVVGKWQEVARVEANNAGAWIKKLEGWIVRQSHDVYAIRRAGFTAWRDAVLPKLDWSRVDLAIGETQESFLAAVYKGLASGIHLKSHGDGKPSGFKGPANIAKRMSQERVLHFRDADAWFDYNEKFGTGNLREAVVGGLERNAQNTGLMKVLGTNPEANYDRIVEDIQRSMGLDPARLQKFSEHAEGYLRNRLKEIDGTTRMPVNHIGARIASEVRAVENMAKLGGALMSQFSDIPLYAAEMKYQGRSFLGAMGESIAALGKGVDKKHHAELYGSIGVFFESMSGQVRDKFSLAEDGSMGAMSRLQQLFFKVNGMRWWSENQRAAAIRSMAHRLGLSTSKAFGQLEPDLQRVLSLYGINDGSWNIIRAASKVEADGRSYLTPEGVEALPDAQFAALLQADGIKPTAKRVADLKTELGDKVRTYYLDRAGFAQLTADAGTAAMLKRGTKPGTVEGEALRFFAQFKSFGFAFAQKAIGRELYGRGSDTFMQALKNGNGEMTGIARMIIATTVFGYGSMVAKDLLKGKTPRDPADYRTWLAAMQQGGGFGIYGDFLFGQANRFGGGLLGTMAGPVLAIPQDLFDIFQTLRDQDTSSPARKAAADAFRFAINNTPFANLFYTRAALDYLILYGIQDALSPGYLRRLEKRVKKQNDQEFLLRPTQHAVQF